VAARAFIVVAAFVAAAIPFAAAAQTPIPGVQSIPGGDLAGRERQRFQEPVAPLAQPGGPAVVLPTEAPPTGAANIKVTIRDICIKGGTIYSKQDLEPLYQNLIGHEIPVQALYDLAKAITAKYGADGYVLSRAIVPPQQFAPHGAVPCIQIVEGYIEKVEWPASVARYRNFFDYYAAKITAERPVNVRTIERYLLLANDLPGLKFSTSLKASPKTQGASILVVELTEKPWDLFGRADNRGTLARGPIQFLASPTANNLFGAHESLNFTWAATAHLQELEYFAVNYRQVLTAEGLYAFFNASHGFGHPGTAVFELLNFKTHSNYGEAGLANPVIRTRELNLTLSGLVFLNNATNDTNIPDPPFGFTAPNTRDQLRGVRVKADLDWADKLLGINQLNVTLSHGFEVFGSTANVVVDSFGNFVSGNPSASRASGRVDFTKLEATISRTQPLFGPFSAFGSLYGQLAGTPILVPEQCGYGGRFFGRAYDPSQLLGDHCFEAIGEVRYDLPKFSPQISQIQLYGYSDYGKVWLLAPLAGTVANISGASVGGGLRVAWLTNVNVDVSTAHAVAGPRNDSRVFFIVTVRN